MKSYQIEKFGLKGLKRVDCNLPRLGANDVLVKVRALSINYRDYLVITGEYNPKLTLPHIPFSDAAGDVVKIGKNVKTIKPGDKVVTCFFQNWQDGPLTKDAALSALGGALPGVLSEYIVLKERGLLHFPAHLNYLEASTLPCSALTAWACLFDKINPMQKDEVLLLLGTGGVSTAALQFAKTQGIKIIITSKSDEKLNVVNQLGADELINYVESPDFSTAVKRLYPEGVDRVIEVGGPGTLNESIKSLKFAGSVYFIGVLAPTQKKAPNLVMLTMKALTLKGELVGSKADFIAMNEYITQHQIKPYYDQVFGFGEVHEALEYFKLGKHIGKICIRVDH